MRFLKRNELAPYVIVNGRHGLRFAADPFSVMDHDIVGTGAYEPEISALLVSLLHSGDVFWDVGANTGPHSMTVKKLLPDVDIVAFEPVPLVFSRLRQNATLNRLDIQMLCVALGRQRHYGTLSVMETGNTGLSSFRPWDDAEYSSTLRCWCDTGDDLVAAGFTSPNVVKIDVEGYELEALEGMRGILETSSLRAMVVESHPSRLGGEGDIGRLLQAVGMRVDRALDERNYLLVRNET